MIEKVIWAFGRVTYHLHVGMSAKSLEWVNDDAFRLIRITSSVLPEIPEWVDEEGNHFVRVPGCILPETFMNFLRKSEEIVN